MSGALRRLTRGPLALRELEEQLIMSNPPNDKRKLQQGASEPPEFHPNPEFRPILANSQRTSNQG